MLGTSMWRDLLSCSALSAPFHILALPEKDVEDWMYQFDQFYEDIVVRRTTERPTSDFSHWSRANLTGSNASLLRASDGSPSHSSFTGRPNSVGTHAKSGYAKFTGELFVFPVLGLPNCPANLFTFAHRPKGESCFYKIYTHGINSTQTDNGPDCVQLKL